VQAVIDAIRDDADGNECIIQFGAAGSPLDIGAEGIIFQNGDGTK
jgi:hypothetical protein